MSKNNEHASTIRNQLKQWFRTGLKPLQAHFWAWIDSFWHKEDIIPLSSIQNLPAILDGKSNVGHTHYEYVTLPEVNSIVNTLKNGLYRLKPSVANLAALNALPVEDNIPGDVRNVLDTNMNYVWDGDSWDALGGNINLTGYVLTSTFNSAIADMATKTWVMSQLQSVTVDLSNYYTKEDVHALLIPYATEAWVIEQIGRVTSGEQMDLSIYALKNATGLNESQITAWRNALRVTDIEVENLYNADGTLTGNRNVNLGGFTLQFLNGYIKANRYSLNVVTSNSHPNSIHTDGNKLKFTNNSGVTQELLTEFPSVQDMLVITSNTNINSSMMNKNIIFDNGSLNLSLIVPSSLPQNFIMSGIKIGTGDLNITNAAGVTINKITITDVIHGRVGSRFMLSRVGSTNVFNLYITNYE